MKSFFFFCTENKLSVNLNLRQFIQTRAGCCFAVALVDLCFPLFKKGKQCLKKLLTHQHNSTWPLLAVHCDTTLLLAVSQTFRHCTSLAAVSSIVQAEGNESTGLQFHLVQLFWPLEPISSIVSLSCHGKVAVGSRTSSPTYKNLTSGQRVGAPVGKTRNVLCFPCTPCSCTAASTCAMGNVQPPKTEKGL